MTTPTFVQSRCESNARRCKHVGSLAPLLALFLANQVFAEPEPKQVNVGIEGTYYVRYDGPRLEAKPVDEKAAIVLRIADVVRDDASELYELRYIGQYPGAYDLRDYLQRIDGEPLDRLERLSVSIGSLLPQDHSGDLEVIAHPPVPDPWPYRWTIVILSVVWLLPALVLIGRRVLRRRNKPPQVSSDEATLEDCLRPLIARAMSGELTRREQAELERKLIGHWRERLELHDCTSVEALRQMREDPVIGQLLRDLERWMHQRPPLSHADLHEILEPYREFAVDA